MSSVSPEIQAKIDAFWKMVQDAEDEVALESDENLAYVQRAPVEQLHTLFLQYRYFNEYYLGDMCILLFRLPASPLKTCLGDIVNDELGEGDFAKAHTNTWDQFLMSIGMTQAQIDGPAAPKVTEMLEGLREEVWKGSVPYAVGLRGMGGECLCQVYLISLHRNFTKNPWTQANQDKIHRAFWDVHTGHEDEAHREMVKDQITDFISEDPTRIDDITAGYAKSREVWDKFWTAAREAAIG